MANSIKKAWKNLTKKIKYKNETRKIEKNIKEIDQKINKQKKELNAKEKNLEDIRKQQKNYETEETTIKRRSAIERNFQAAKNMNKILDKALKEDPERSSPKTKWIIKEAKNLTIRDEQIRKYNERNNIRNTHSTEENSSSASTTQAKEKGPEKNSENSGSTQGQQNAKQFTESQKPQLKPRSSSLPHPHDNLINNNSYGKNDNLLVNNSSDPNNKGIYNDRIENPVGRTPQRVDNSITKGEKPEHNRNRSIG